MVRHELKTAPRIRRKDPVPAEHRTEARDQLADWIDEHVVGGERDWYHWTQTEIGDAYGCSRQHVSDVLDAYFEPADQPRDPLAELAAELGDGDRAGEGYVAGLRDGFTEGVKFALENQDALRDLAGEP